MSGYNARAILARDGYMCRYCGGKADTVDHVVPRSLRGTDDEDNLVAACRRCNSAKGSIPVGPLPPASRALCASRERSGRCRYHASTGSQIGSWTEGRRPFTLAHCGHRGCPPFRVYMDFSGGPVRDADYRATWVHPNIEAFIRGSLR